MRGAHLLYYTNLSNWLLILLSLALLWANARRLLGQPMPAPNGWFSNLRFGLVTGILLTFVAFTFLLAPFLELWYLASPANVLVHNLVPLLSVLDYCLFIDPRETQKPKLYWAMLLPFLYLLFTLLLAQFGAFFQGGKSRFPYYFLDPSQQGWFTLSEGKLGVVYWWLLLALLVLLLGKGLLALRSFIQRRRKPKVG